MCARSSFRRRGLLDILMRLAAYRVAARHADVDTASASRRDSFLCCDISAAETPKHLRRKTATPKAVLTPGEHAASNEDMSYGMGARGIEWGHVVCGLAEPSPGPPGILRFFFCLWLRFLRPVGEPLAAGPERLFLGFEGCGTKSKNCGKKSKKRFPGAKESRTLGGTLEMNP